eukprot:UN29190
MDVLLCNGLGIEFGLYILKYLEAREYSWVPFMNLPTLKSKIKRSFKQFFFPRHWAGVAGWERYSIVRKYLYYSGFILIFSIADLNMFLLKLWLWVPSNHWFVLARTILMGFCCFVSCRQVYFFFTDEKCDVLGTQCWIQLMILFVEFCIIYKVSPELPPAPRLSKIIWFSALGT